MGIQKNGALHTLRPVIVVAETPQTGFNAADENGYILVGAADQVAVNHGGVVRALAHDAAGGKGVGFPAVLGDGIVVYHGVHVAAGHQKAQPGTAKHVDGLGVFPVRLGDNPHAVAVVLQNPADDGVAEGRVIHIGIADDVDEITLLPAARAHFLGVDGKKIHISLLIGRYPAASGRVWNRFAPGTRLP